MEKVIINVDDFGVSKDYNQYVKALIKSDKVSSASISVCRNAESAQDALLYAKDCDKRISFGLHLDLSGYFHFDELGVWGRDENHIIERYRDIIKEKYTDIRLDIEHQFNTFVNYGVPITHLIGHHNIHLFPEVRDILLPIMLGYNVRKCRFYDGFYLSNSSLLKTKMLYEALGIKTPNNLIVGIPKDVKRNLTTGVNEIMIHASFEVERGLTQFDYLMDNDCFKDSEVISYFDV